MCPVSACTAETKHTDLQLPEEVQPGRGLHLLGVKIEGQDEDGDDHRGHDLQRNLGVRHAAGGRRAHTHTQMHTVFNIRGREISSALQTFPLPAASPGSVHGLTARGRDREEPISSKNT